MVPVIFINIKNGTTIIHNLTTFFHPRATFYTYLTGLIDHARGKLVTLGRVVIMGLLLHHTLTNVFV